MTKYGVGLAGILAMCAATHAMGETFDLRRSCSTWEFIPANSALSSPAAALLSCQNRDTEGTWFAIQVLCLANRDIVELRYQTGYEAVPLTLGPKDTETSEVSSESDSTAPKTVYEMVSFLTSNGGYHHAGEQHPITGAWHFSIDTIHYPLLSAIATGNYIDVALGPVFDVERLPLRGSAKAINGVKQACSSVTGS